ncbi:OmpA family protein [Paracoccus sp. Z118]|uniref:OmpA family protein n=1 Tax=Paracoccus sp. Z118 TaxID=2851017 RepID=UPI001C2C05DA|nr:OmpA family protein [Paracoccus sp. Z118]MBV0890905.1 OmpA family protein [Paracoccus sp. Z118]
MRLPFLLGLVLLAPPLGAQELSDDALAERFLRQREAFRAAERPDLGAPRGLELITVDDLTTAPEVAADDSAEEGRPAVAAAAPLASQPVRVEPSAPPGGLGGVTVHGSGRETPPAVPVLPTITAAAAPPTPAPVVFGRLDPELQVNVRVNFPFDSAVLTDEQTPRLEQLCRVMKGSDIALFRIVGHTDALGTDAYNERLSLLRAEEVERYFVRECGILPARLEAVGFGERFLFDRDDPAAAGNRRVEFQAIS